MITFVYDPISLVVSATQKTYPSINAEVQFNPELTITGCTTIRKGKSSLVDISSDISLEGVIEQLIHEFAHVVTGTEENHPEKWENAKTKIENEFNSLVEKELSKYKT